MPAAGMRDYYEVLGVERTATAEDIKRAYRRMAHRYHPDKNPDDTYAEERFKQATEAYEILGDQERRRRYDRFGRAGVGGGASGFGPGFGNNVGDVFSEIFSDIFNKRQKSRGRERGTDRVYPLKIDFKTAALGGERVIPVRHSKRCGSCSGTGAAPGSSPQICHACGGSGEIRVQQGLFSMGKRCTYCSGRGRIITNPCGTCDGQGLLQQDAQLKVRIPRGADDGTTLRYKGEGEPGMGGGPPGDLRVVLEIEPHPLFERDGADIRVELPITLVEAALGSHIEVPTLHGRVRMKIPPGTQSGRVFRLREKGLPQLQGGGHGDQQVTVRVETPRELSDIDRRILKSLDELDSPKHYPDREAFWGKVE